MLISTALSVKLKMIKMENNLTAVKNLITNDRIAYTDSYLSIAKLLLEDKFLFQHVYDMEPCPETYEVEDWHKSPNGDPEWLYVLNRQEYLQDLMVAYFKTDEIEYLEKAKSFMFEWVANDYDAEEFRYSAWRTIDTGIRLLNWSQIYKLLIMKNLLNEDEKKKLDLTIEDQAKYLKDNYIDKYDLSNWGVLITTGVLCFNAVNPDVIDDDLVQWSLDKLSIELGLQVDDDGIHWEQSPLYFIEVFRSSLCVYSAYKNADLDIPDVITNKLNLMLKALHYLIMPSGKLVQQGDTDAVKVADLVASAELILLSKTSETNYDLVPLEFYSLDKFQRSTDQDVTLPNYFDANISGNFYLKDNQKTYWHYFSGSLGSGHGHVSLGHLDLTINGQNILVDPGRLTYINTPERRFLKSGASHNIVSIDGIYPIEPRDSWKFSRETTANRNYVAHSKNYDVIVSGYHDIENEFNYTRYFIWLKEYDVAVVFDVGFKPGQHIKQNNWIISPELTAENSKGSRIELLNENQTEFDIYSSDETTKGKDQLYSPRYNEKENTLKIETESKFEDNFVSYTVIGSKKAIKNVKRLTPTHTAPVEEIADIRCYPIAIELNDGKTINLVLQHENTIRGDKVYYIDGKSYYGTLSLLEDGEFTRLL